MALEKHDFQWDSTENALTWIFDFIKKKNDPEKFFLETLCFATEKYDGTNIAKDDTGQVYSRRFPIEEGEEEFIKTSLRKVREADVAQFKNLLIEAACLDPENITKCIVYGEFICNAWYDYSERDILGDWKVFGAKMEVRKENIETLVKLAEAGFAVPNRSGNPNHVKIYPNEKFFELAKKANMDVPDSKGTNENLAKIIVKNKDDMKRGLIEGVVITIYQEKDGSRLIKWKGAQEYQPHAHTKFLKANDLVQNSGAHEDVKKAFHEVSEVITDTSENELVKKLETKKAKHGNPEEKKKTKGKYLSNIDKDIILLGIPHSQKKFDSIEVYQKRGEKALEEYRETLIHEVKEHLAKEKNDFEGIDDETTVAFITSKVKSTIKTQLEESDTNRAN
eukprot:GFUD01015050.1.p1 GENE.GFUD01015050.1~~GFUD01015050.1.p1  ORF type:complete len:419 (+),score=119.47 GFUD01015050.1:81-1259(+)